MTPMIQSCVLHFGEMGSRWGINRTVGQIYALLVLSDTALNADQIGDNLSISRSNVSMGLKELQSWRLIRPQHIPGDRKEYYTTPEDVWDIARTLIEERRKREMDPTLTVLRDLLLEEPPTAKDAYAQDKMRDMLGLIEMITHWTTEMQRMDSGDLQKILMLGSGISKLLDLKELLRGKPGEPEDTAPS